PGNRTWPLGPATGPGRSARRQDLAPRPGTGSSHSALRTGHATIWTPMFDALSDRLRTTLGKLTGHGRISEADVDAAMREVRLALLEADVNFKVVKDFVAR